MIVSYGDYGFLVLPAEIMAEADKLDADMRRVNGAVSASGDSTFQAGWGAFYGKWRDYYDSLTGVTGWLSRLMSAEAVRSTIPEYRTQLAAWESDFRMRGGDVVGGPVQKPVEQANLLTYMKWGLAIYLVVTFAPVVVPGVKKWAPVIYGKAKALRKG